MAFSIFEALTIPSFDQQTCLIEHIRDILFQTIGVICSYSHLFFFFFQAEDGIRDLTVTGVQTCALPIYEMGPERLRPIHPLRAVRCDLDFESGEAQALVQRE